MGRLVVLVDNRAAPGLREAWGLSILVEAHGSRVLFDTGPSPDVLCDNARALGVGLEELDAIIVSHPHRDHYGGLPCAAQHSPGTVVVLPPSPGHLVAWIRRLGLAPVTVKGSHRPAPGYATSGALRAGIGLYEHALAVETAEGPLVLLGCSHPGGDRLVERALGVMGAGRAWLVMGGLHDPPRSVVDRLASMARLLAPIHCSGGARDYARTRYPDRYLDAAAGTMVELPG